MLEIAPRRLPPPSRLDGRRSSRPRGARRKRVALLDRLRAAGARPDINAATIRLLTRHGCEVVIAEGVGCCGALTHHMGKTRGEPRGGGEEHPRPGCARCDGAGLDAIVINTSGCGTTVKDYGHMFEGEPLAADAAAVAGLARDITEVMAELGLGPPVAGCRRCGCLSRGLLAAARPADARRSRRRC